jgi:hypothetical protein
MFRVRIGRDAEQGRQVMAKSMLVRWHHPVGHES